MTSILAQHREKMANYGSVTACLRRSSNALLGLAFVALSFVSLKAQAQYEPAKTPKNFEEMQAGLKKNYQFKAPVYTHSQLTVGRTYYFPLEVMKSGQHEISFTEAQNRIEEHVEQQSAVTHGLTRQNLFYAMSTEERAQATNPLQFDDGRALLPGEKAGEVILLKDCILLIDGNHKAMASIWLGAKTFPARVKLDLKTKTLSEAMPELLERGYVWPYLGGEKVVSAMSDFTHLTDNPLRNWVSQAIGAVKLDRDPTGPYRMIKKRSNKFPLAIKIQKERAFWEWIIVLALESQGFQAHLGEENSPTKKSVELARELLNLALAPESDFVEKARLEDIFLGSSFQVYQNDKALLKELTSFLKARDCKYLLP